jgi:hypothetical protein
MSLPKILPEQIDDFLKQLVPGIASPFLFSLKQWYLPDNPPLLLLVVAIADDLDKRKIRVLVTDDSVETQRSLIDQRIDGKTLAELAVAWKAPLLDLSQPIKLQSVSIAKPWGREIWYTGIEQRGLSLVSDGQFSMPLAWLIGLVPGQMMGSSEGLPGLLKILDPLPEEVYGDLYFELHEEKREVYVVTHVDEKAWPESIGRIRFGFSPKVRNSYDSDSEFRSSYLKAVVTYRLVRDEIDKLVDNMRCRDGIALDEPVSVLHAKRWQEELPAELCERELSARKAMELFTQLRPLEIGDVVKVPLLMPHSLQHGVRTIEFQSPVYERKILSFCQKVLTQEGWDTEEAVQLMSLESTESRDLEVIQEESAVLRELVAQFSDFEVQRLTLKNSGIWTLTGTNTHKLVITIDGFLDIGGCKVGPEQAVFIPANCCDLYLSGLTDQPCRVLISQPRH